MNAEESDCFTRDRVYVGAPFLLKRRLSQGDATECQTLCQKRLLCRGFSARVIDTPDLLGRKYICQLHIVSVITISKIGWVSGPKYCPSTDTAKKIQFKDTDLKKGYISGAVTILPSKDKSRLNTYSLYWSDGRNAIKLIQEIPSRFNVHVFNIPQDTVLQYTHFMVIGSSGVFGRSKSSMVQFVEDASRTVYRVIRIHYKILNYCIFKQI